MKVLRQSKNTEYTARTECYDPDKGEVVKILSSDGEKFIYIMKLEEGAGCADCPLCGEKEGDYNCTHIPIWCSLVGSYTSIDSILEDL